MNRFSYKSDHIMIYLFDNVLLQVNVSVLHQMFKFITDNLMEHLRLEPKFHIYRLDEINAI